MIHLFLLFSIIFTHPLDNGPFSEKSFTGINKEICFNNKYVSPIDGNIDETIQNNNKFTTHLTQKQDFEYISRAPEIQ